MDPRDSRWIRFPLACWLFQVGDERSLKRLIRICYRRGRGNKIGEWTELDHFTFFSYLEALMIFRRSGQRPSGRAKFETALYEPFEENSLVPEFLLGRTPLPAVRVRKIYSDPLLQAIHCAQHSLELWQSVPGALKCLGEIIDRRAHGTARGSGATK